MINIDEKRRADIKEVLKKYGAMKAFISGSVARGDQHESSARLML